MIEQTESDTLFEAGKTSNNNDATAEYLERFQRIISQLQPAASLQPRQQPRAVVKLNKARQDLLMRSFEAMAREISQFDEAEITKLATKSDPKMLVEVVVSFLSDSPFDRTERMHLKGAERFRALLNKFGGSVSTKWVCEFLGANESAIRKRVQRKTLLVRRMPNGELSFPLFQFNQATGNLIQDLPAFLAHVRSWAVDDIVRFLLVRHNPRESHDNPMEILKLGKLDQVIELADLHLSQRP